MTDVLRSLTPANGFPFVLLRNNLLRMVDCIRRNLISLTLGTNITLL